jgi:hypothetical protein
MTLPASNRVSIGLASVLLLTHCASHDEAPNGGSGASGAMSVGASAGTGTSTAGMGGATSSGGSTAGGAFTGGSAGAMATGGAPIGGSTSAGGAPTGGTTHGGAPGGGETAMGGAAGGTSSDAGSSGSGNSSAGGASGTGGDSSAAGASGSSGSAGTGTAGMAGAGGGAEVDEAGVPLAKPGDSKNGSREYLNLGDMRLIVNKWGSDELNCNTSLRVFAANDRTFGWEFDRGACGGDKAKPDYPEIEFGIHPFGAGNSLATTPSFSTTSLLPIQIKDITSASVVLDGLNIAIERASTYNLNFEFWLSQRNPVTDPNPGVHAELITFFGWQDSWACDKTGNVQAGDRGFTLCHQDDAWAGGKWRYFQFRIDGGSTNSFSGKVDVKALIDWLVSNAGYSRDLWVTRLEVGSEIDDNTTGKVTLRNITFEVNGTSKAARLGQ